jgi:hypothetical protein
MVGLHDDCGNLPAQAVGAFCDYLRNLHEIFVPSRARIIYGGFLFHVAYFSTFSSLCAVTDADADVVDLICPLCALRVCCGLRTHPQIVV